MNESTPPPVIMPGGNAIQPRFVLWCITIVPVGLSLFQLYSAGIQQYSPSADYAVGIFNVPCFWAQP